jgi:hypothetical protein
VTSSDCIFKSRDAPEPFGLCNWMNDLQKSSSTPSMAWTSSTFYSSCSVRSHLHLSSTGSKKERRDCPWSPVSAGPTDADHRVEAGEAPIDELQCTARVQVNSRPSPSIINSNPAGPTSPSDSELWEQSARECRFQKPLAEFQRLHHKVSIEGRAIPSVSVGVRNVIP